MPLRLRQTLLAVFLALSVMAASSARAEMVLIMVEEDGCIWCARWNAEVGDAYHKTAEGRAAPLKRIDIGDPVLDTLSLTSRPRLTPTFILAEDGRELARLEGYPGEDFFWPLLGRMLTGAGVLLEFPDPAETGARGE